MRYLKLSGIIGEEKEQVVKSKSCKKLRRTENITQQHTKANSFREGAQIAHLVGTDRKTIQVQLYAYGWPPSTSTENTSLHILIAQRTVIANYLINLAASLKVLCIFSPYFKLNLLQ